MRTKIGTKVYDTEKSQLIGEQVVGQYCSADGFEERLYRKAAHDYFIYGLGGSLSPYPQETLLSLSLADATEWMQRIMGAERATEILQADEAELAKKAEVKATKAAKTSKTVKETTEKSTKSCCKTGRSKCKK